MHAHPMIRFPLARRRSLRAALAAAVVAATTGLATAAPLDVLHDFSDDPRRSAGGSMPIGGLVEAAGALFGTATGGGGAGRGSVYRVDASGRARAIHAFRGPDGEAPLGELTPGADGRLYGTAQYGGRCGVCGTLFAIAADGRFEVLHRLRYAAEGGTPNGALLAAADGALYGTTYRGGRHGAGTLFRYAASTGFEVLAHLGGGSDPAAPESGLVAGADGALYGTSTAGGRHGAGTVFRVDPDRRRIEVLFSFDAQGPGFVDGANPRAALLAASDGALYGTTASAGLHNAGTLFRLRPGSGFERLHTFGEGAGGTGPAAALAEAADGALYGVTIGGGAQGSGTVFRLGRDGRYEEVHAFSGGDGSTPWGRLLPQGDALVGTTYSGGARGGGVVYRLRAPR